MNSSRRSGAAPCAALHGQGQRSGAHGEAEAEGDSQAGSRNRRGRCACWSRSNEPALRPRRGARRAQRGQVDPGQCAGRAEGRDRQPQGADHARPADGHRDRGRGADPAGRHAGHLRAQPPARPGDGRGRLGRRRGRRPDRAGDRRRGQGRRAGRSDARRASKTAASRRSWSSTRSTSPRRRICSILAAQLSRAAEARGGVHGLRDRPATASPT